MHAGVKLTDIIVVAQTPPATPPGHGVGVGNGVGVGVGNGVGVGVGDSVIVLQS